jgi:hypothetical protein
MKRHSIRIGLGIAAVCAVIGASAQEAAPQLSLTDGAQRTGSIMRKEVAWSTELPLNRTYAQLTPDQKAHFHSMYVLIAPGDEPPFPERGLKSVVNAIYKAQEMLLAHGQLRFIVTVGADGKGKKVEAFGDCDRPDMTQFTSQVLLLTKYKPAVCGGVACVMEFPFNLQLKVKK